MAVDFRREVDYVARLARLTLGEEEKKIMAGQLGSILEIAKRIQELDTSDVEPTSHTIDLPAVLRDDEIKPSLATTRVLQNAPQRDNDFFKVPAITVLQQFEQQQED